MIAKFTRPLRRVFTLVRRDDGVTMIVILGVMTVTSLLVIAAFTSANGEVHLTATDTSQKKAYYAAEAGVEDYEYHLTQDGDYLDYCTEPEPANPALNQYYNSTETTPLQPSELKKAKVPAIGKESSEEEYSIQLVPAESDKLAHDKKCDPNHVVETMVEESGSATGTFRIRSTGFSGNSRAVIVATFRNANFVSYVWYTVYEVGDPVVDGEPPSGEPNYWTECAHFYPEREALPKKQCKPLNNFFGTGESVKGPMHVEDHVGVCGEPSFGRDPEDRVEFGNGKQKEAAVGYSNEGCSAAANPKFVGTEISPGAVQTLPPPPGDEELEHIVESPYHFHGKTEIILENTKLTIRKFSKSGVTEEKGIEYPENGVIYVSNSEEGTCRTYSPFGPVPSYAEDTYCGNAYVRGKYEDSLTIAAQNDVIINGSITTPTSPENTALAVPTTNALLGLIANNFVRIYHPLSGSRGSKLNECGSSSNLTTGKEGEKDLNNPLIYAAMLALKHAVIADNFDCGAPELGHLNVYGTLAGLFSNGLTGLIDGSTLVHGYSYNAEYDNRLQVSEPPHFLNPIQAAWYIQRQTLAGQP
jgi:Tfp pilus assembly protein PilX